MNPLGSGRSLITTAVGRIVVGVVEEFKNDIVLIAMYAVKLLAISIETHGLLLN